jgi:microcystin-dependent protein
MEPFMGMIAMFGFSFAPEGWALCNGQLMSIQQNSALFALLGTTYGGDGVQTFALPNLQSRVPIGMGTGPGLSTYVQGQVGGEENHTLLSTEMPQHSHSMQGSNDPAAQPNAGLGSLPSNSRGGGNLYATGVNSLVPMASPTTPTGGNQAHNNTQPYLVMNYCIALVGDFPQRS